MQNEDNYMKVIRLEEDRIAEYDMIIAKQDKNITKEERDKIIEEYYRIIAKNNRILLEHERTIVNRWYGTEERVANSRQQKK